jgi:hypothetical protein
MKTTCRETGIEFEISADDVAFYQKISPRFGDMLCPVPPPTLCPEARVRRRLCFRNERTLYRRTCDFSGKSIISTYAPGTPFPVYDNDIWYSDAWDGKTFGREFDPRKSFFHQFGELMREVPVFALSQRLENENSRYTNLVSNNRNCYYIFAGSLNEDCFYSTYIQRCRDVADSFFIFDSELCYECIDCFRCYQLLYSQECENCSSSQYLIGCTGCSDCFGCVSLIKRRYCIFNRQYSRTDYQAALTQLLNEPQYAARTASTLQRLLTIEPRKFYAGLENDGFSGDHLAYCKNAYSCFDCTHLEDCKYCTWLHQGKDCYDCYAWGLNGELGLENHLVGNNFFRVLFCEDCANNVSDLLYCRGCYSNCRHLFGCIGLRQAEYCVLNKQYSKEEYEQLVPKIIQRMNWDGEWGEFFPAWLSPYGYNETVAAEYFPLTKEEAEQLGFHWRSQPLPGVYSGTPTPWEQLVPDALSSDPDLPHRTFACTISGKHFRFTQPELKLYRKLGVDLPRRCFDQRYLERFRRRNPRRLFQRCCRNCGQEILSSFTAEREECILCESCFSATRC